MADIGSVFLGDSKRHRALWGTTPPSSPPPTVAINQTSMFSALPSPVLSTTTRHHTHNSTSTTATRPIDSAMSLELRVRWLEALLYGVSSSGSKKGKEREGEEPLIRSTENLQRKLHAIVDANDSLKRFMSHCVFPHLSHPFHHIVNKYDNR